MNRFMARVLAGLGATQLDEISGPPAIEPWVSCHGRFTTASICFDYLNDVWLDRYGVVISDYNTTCPKFEA